MKEVVFHPMETNTSIRKTPQNFKGLELKVSWHQQSIKIFTIHTKRLEICDLPNEDFKIAVLNDSLCYRKCSKKIKQKHENNKQMNSKKWTKLEV